MIVPPLHADDAMGVAAHEASQFAHLFQYRLLVAASPYLDRVKRTEGLRLVLEQWPKLCRAMAKLEQIAPNTARVAQEADATMRDYVETLELEARRANVIPRDEQESRRAGEAR